jgi:lipopolysaccharide biosynthesis glycosyltransferase
VQQIPLYVGYDPREAVAYSVFCHSVLRRTKAQVSFTPVTGESRDGTNAFIYERFRVAEMCGFKGWAIFCDGDMICRADIEELWDLRDVFGKDVMVVKHNYKTKFQVKYLGQKNDDYPRKNWSSVMLVNCNAAAWQRMTGERIAKMSGKELHRFTFLEEDRIGSLPKEWNWLSGEQPYNPDAKIAHFTIGTPCFHEYRDWDYADEWLAERDSMLSYEGAPCRQAG